MVREFNQSLERYQQNRITQPPVESIAEIVISSVEVPAEDGGKRGAEVPGEGRTKGREGKNEESKSWMP
ncbi:hypothetical protein TWF281_002852 [Arthrobotrys megalospora]